jgi:two-component system response regulator RegA
MASTNQADEYLRKLAVIFENMMGFIQEGEACLAELRAVASPTLGATASLATRSTVLLVDDDGPLLRAMVRALQRDFELSTASSVEQALSLIEAQPFDAVVSDFHLPDGQGVRVLNDFAFANPNGVRVLYTGAALDAEIIKRSVAGGLIHRVLAKPAMPDAVRAALADELAKKSR